MPERLALGAGFSCGDVAGGMALTTGIAIQDRPEGVVVAIALMATGYGRGFSFAVGTASGLVEPVGTVVGAAIVTSFPWQLPLDPGFAAGAILSVVSHEIIPEAHRQGHENFAAGLMFRFVVMMTLDAALGRFEPVMT